MLSMQLIKKESICPLLLPNYFWMAIRSGKVTCRLPMWATANSFLGYQFLGSLKPSLLSIPREWWPLSTLIHTYLCIYVHIHYMICIWERIYSFCPSEFRSHLILCFPDPSTLPKMSWFPILCSWIIVYSVYVPYCHFLFFCWGRGRLAPSPWCCG